MAFDRLCSIVFYMVIAALTCFMAYQTEPSQGYRLASVRIGGRRTRAFWKDKVFITGIFLILFSLASLRFDIGNDYWNYTQTAHEAYVGGYVVTEAGFNLLVKFLYLMAGMECYELVFAVFSFFTLLIFFKAFERQGVSFAQSFFIFMMLGLYFQTFNTVRYYLALAIALYSMKYVLDRDIIKFIVCILAGALFHKSLLIVIPAYWIASFGWKRWHILAGLGVSAGCFLAKGLVLQLALALYPSYKNTVFLDDADGSLISTVRIAAVLALYAWFCVYTGERAKGERWYRELRFYGQLNMLAFVAGVFFRFLPVVSRIVYYFSVSQLLMLPLVLAHIEDLRVKRIVKMVIFCGCVVYFMMFLFQAHDDSIKLLPYRSWLFEKQRYTFY